MIGVGDEHFAPQSPQIIGAKGFHRCLRCDRQDSRGPHVPMNGHQGPHAGTNRRVGPVVGLNPKKFSQERSPHRPQPAVTAKIGAHDFDSRGHHCASPRTKSVGCPDYREAIPDATAARLNKPSDHTKTISRPCRSMRIRKIGSWRDHCIERVRAETHLNLMKPPDGHLLTRHRKREP